MLRKLAERKLLRWREDTILFEDREGLVALAGYERSDGTPRPLI